MAPTADGVIPSAAAFVDPLLQPGYARRAVERTISRGAWLLLTSSADPGMVIH